MLRGNRVTLRAVQRDDLLRLWAFNNDLAVELAGGGEPPWPQSLERLQAEFDQQAGQGGRDGMTFAIEADDVCIGQCALFNLDQTARTAELGITIGDKAYWGRGYGRECIRLLLRYAFRYQNLHKVWLQVHRRNERAAAAYRACGFAEEGSLRQHVWSNGQYDDLVFMGLLRVDWKDDDDILADLI